MDRNSVKIGDSVKIEVEGVVKSGKVSYVDYY